MELYEEGNHNNFCPLRFAAAQPPTHPTTPHLESTDTPPFWPNNHYPPPSSIDFTQSWEDKPVSHHLSNYSSFHPGMTKNEKNSITATITTKATSQGVVVSSSKKPLPSSHSNDHHYHSTDHHYHCGPDLVMNQNYHFLVLQDQTKQPQQPQQPQPQQQLQQSQQSQPPKLQQVSQLSFPPQLPQPLQPQQHCKVDSLYDPSHTCILSTNTINKRHCNNNCNNTPNNNTFSNNPNNNNNTFNNKCNNSCNNNCNNPEMLPPIQ